MRDLRTSESVTEGHPDKICDRISDAILDEILSKDKFARVACETAVTTGLVFVMGEITTKCYIDIQNIVRNVLRSIGYVKSEFGIDCMSCAVLSAIDEQSLDISMGVNTAKEYNESYSKYDKTGAGDQGVMFGYACNETKELMPLPITLAHCLTKALSENRKSGSLPWLRPDGKALVTIEYEDERPLYIDTIVLSAQHDENIKYSQICDDLTSMARNVLPKELITPKTRFLINPTGRFVIGGPQGDSGLTGRKIIVDTYGGYCPHGGGAFSGKDPTKVDRSGAYMARYVAKNLVASGICNRIQIELAYSIGHAKPVAITLNTFGTNQVCNDKILEIVEACFDFRPEAIIDNLSLRNPIYEATSNYGHFGNPSFAWEQLNKVESILKLAKNQY